MKKIFLTISTVLLLLFASTLDTPALAGSRWDASICSAIGFNPEVEPKVGHIVSNVTGQITNATKLTNAGLSVRKGDLIQMTGFGNCMWIIKNIRTGQSVTRWYDFDSLGSLSSAPLMKE